MGAIDLSSPTAFYGQDMLFRSIQIEEHCRYLWNGLSPLEGGTGGSNFLEAADIATSYKLGGKYSKPSWWRHATQQKTKWSPRPNVWTLEAFDDIALDRQMAKHMGSLGKVGGDIGDDLDDPVFRELSGLLKVPPKKSPKNSADASTSIDPDDPTAQSSSEKRPFFSGDFLYRSGSDMVVREG